jgi:long-chain acyl-CoA synthetase
VTIGDTLHTSAARTPRHAALWAGADRISYKRFDACTDRLAAWLLKQGLRPGDRLAIHWPNSIEAAKLYFGAFKAGVIAVPVNLRLKAPEITYVFQHSGAVMCFSAPSLAPLAEAAAANCTDMRRILTALPSDPPVGKLPEIDPDQPLTIIYTSGTTARPKGVVHTHKTFLGCLRRGVESRLLCGGGMTLCMTPMMHIAGLAMLVTSVYLGETAVLVSFDPAVVLDAIERHRCTFFFVLPALGQSLIEEQIRRRRDVSSLRVVVAGGDTVPVNMQERFHEHFGFRLQEGYGLTEGGFLAFNPPDAIRTGSMGRRLPNVEMRLVDPAGNDVKAGEMGEIIVRSSGSCTGYWNDPAATADLLRGGWLHTGDLASRDADDYLWFRGRSKQIIVRDGSNISPQEVEEALYGHPAVFEVGVTGKPDPIHGELVVAFIAVRPGAFTSEAELQAFARERLADYKTPEHIYFLPELPKGLTGKVDRRTLKEMLRSQYTLAAAGAA